MPISNDKIETLFKRFLENNCTREELQELYNQIDQVEDESILKLMDVHYENLSVNDKVDNVDWNYMFSQITKKQAPVQKLVSFRRIAVAASIIFALVIGTYFLFSNKTGKQTEIVKTDNSIQPDIMAPEKSRAMITLDNGQRILLDSAGSGQLAIQANVKLMRLENGEIAYQATPGTTVGELQYNTLYNPRGSKPVSLSLNDGTKIWLNSESSLKYPIAFAGSERKVEITGEAYFEVTKNALMPFKVNVAGRGEVEVLGTHFNVNSYSDEPSINTTLLEGSVKVTSLATNNSQLIKPGELAELGQSGEINVNKNVNIAEVMAWKNGKFIFQDLDIQSIMRQISKWYDVDVEYRGTITNEQFVGVISRNVNVSEIIKMLEKTGAVNLEIDGKRIIVK